MAVALGYYSSLTVNSVSERNNTWHSVWYDTSGNINPLNAELNPICHLLALLGAHHILHVSRIRVKLWAKLSIRTSVSSILVCIVAYSFVDWLLRCYIPFFWVIPRRLNFIFRRFGTLFSIFIGSVSRKNNRSEISSWLFFLLTLPMKIEQTECSETSIYKIEKPGNHAKERIQHSLQGESLKSITITLFDDAIWTAKVELSISSRKAADFQSGSIHFETRPEYPPYWEIIYLSN